MQKEESLRIETKTFVLLLINCGYFFAGGGRRYYRKVNGQNDPNHFSEWFYQGNKQLFSVLSTVFEHDRIVSRTQKNFRA